MASDQSASPKSEQSCNTKLVEGRSQARMRLPFVGAMLTDGDGVEYEVKIAPETYRPDTATMLLPSAEQATAFHCWTGTLFDVHVKPEFAEL